MSCDLLTRIRVWKLVTVPHPPSDKSLFSFKYHGSAALGCGYISYQDLGWYPFSAALGKLNFLNLCFLIYKTNLIIGLISEGFLWELSDMIYVNLNTLYGSY